MVPSVKYVTLFLTNFDLHSVTLCHSSRNLLPNVRHPLELENLDDFPASMCASELCKECSIKSQLFCKEIVEKLTTN